MNKKLSVIILSYNTKDITVRCLESISNIGVNQNYEVFVVDNCSCDNSISSIKNLFAWVKLIENKDNFGFARANNQAIKLAQGEYILLLNSDTENSNSAIEKTLAFIEANPQIDVITCRVELADGKIDPACHRGFPTPWASFCYFVGLEKLFPNCKLFGQYHLTYKSYSSPHEIDSPSGCFYLLRRSIIDKVGLLDEDYFFFGEDIDWSYRIKQAGGKIYYFPYAKIIHHKGSSSGIKKGTQLQSTASNTTKIRAINSFYDAMKIFYDKHYKTKYSFIITWLVYLGIAIKRRLSLIKLRV